MKYQKAPDVKKIIDLLIAQLDFFHIKKRNVHCIRSFDAKTRAFARIWGMAKLFKEIAPSGATDGGGRADEAVVGGWLGLLGQQAVECALALRTRAQHGLAQLPKALGGLQHVDAQAAAGYGEFGGLRGLLQHHLDLGAGLLHTVGIAVEQSPFQTVQPGLQRGDPGVGVGSLAHGDGPVRGDQARLPLAPLSISAALDNILSAIASALTWKLPLAMAAFMDSTFSALNTSLPLAVALCIADTVDDDSVTVTPAFACGLAAAPAAAAPWAPADGLSAVFCGPPATEPM